MYDTIKILGTAHTFYDPERMFWTKDWDCIELMSEKLEDQWIPWDGCTNTGTFITQKKKVMWKHEETDLRIMGHRIEGLEEHSPDRDKSSLAVMNAVEYALPKQIFETNGSLITSQNQIDHAQSRAMGLIHSVCPSWETSHFSRLDLVWHYAFDPFKTMQELKRLRHPRIRKATTEYNENESLIFRGKERKLRIYDKLKEMVNRRGSVTRVEVQLNGRSLVNDFEQIRTDSHKSASIGADIPHSKEEAVVQDGRLRNLPSFDAAYKVYREFLQQMEPVRTPKFSRLYDLLAHLNKDGTKFNSTGQPVIDAYLMNLSPSSRSRVKREIRKHRLNWSEFSFRSLLNEASPPNPIHIHKDKREVLFEERPQRRREQPQSSWSTAKSSPGYLDKVERAIA